jgi:hypothetical protein
MKPRTPTIDQRRQELVAKKAQSQVQSKMLQAVAAGRRALDMKFLRYALSNGQRGMIENAVSTAFAKVEDRKDTLVKAVRGVVVDGGGAAARSLGVMRTAGGAGSGNFGHGGRPGEVGGSAEDSSPPVSVEKTSAEFNSKLYSDMNSFIAGKSTIGMGLKESGAYSLIRAMKEDNQSAFTMAREMEKVSSREATLDAFGTQVQWLQAGVFESSKELDAASGKLSGDQQRAYETRAAVHQELFSRDHPDLIDAEGNVTLYRGVTGPQAKQLEEGKDVSLVVRSLSSWTLSKRDAQGFAERLNATGRATKYGALLEAKVHLRDVWSVPREYGPQPAMRYADDRHEVVVRARSGSVASRVLWSKGLK